VTPPVEIRPPAHRPTRASVRATRIGVVAMVFAASAFVLWLMVAVVFRDPGFVDRVRIDNPTGYDIHVDIAERDAQSRLPLGVAGQRCTTEFQDVIDPGPTWVVRFTAQGRDAGELTVSRTELERDGWTVRVPDEVVDRLAAAGAPSTPRHSCASA